MLDPVFLWLTFGFVLIAIELFVVDMLFVLVLVGIAALVMALLQWIVPGLPFPFFIFGVLSVSSVVLFRKRLYEKVHAVEDTVDFEEGFIGDQVEVSETIPPKGLGRVMYRGGGWTAQNESDDELTAGSRAIVTGLASSCLLIKADTRGRGSE